MPEHWPDPGGVQSIKQCKNCGAHVSQWWSEMTDRQACVECVDKLRRAPERAHKRGQTND